MIKVASFVLLLLVLPGVAAAAVTISEVAWMGSAQSANHEWIELYNDGSDVVVDGWQLTDGNNVNIALVGTIAGGSYVVLERTSDDSAPGAAFGIYTGALSNGGATLYLVDDTGATVDQVDGGEDWANIGGDNQTKDTANRKSGAWITAAPTPGSGAGDEVVAPPPETTTTETADTNTSSSGSSNSNTSSASKKNAASATAGEKIVLALPDNTLQLNIDAPTFVYVNQTVTFDVQASGPGETIIKSLQYSWNLGDGTTASGTAATHYYKHPGRYVVVVDGAYKRQQQVARVEIEVLPVAVTLFVTDDGLVQVTNSSDTEVNLGGYRLVGYDDFVVPKHTIVLPGQTLTLPGAHVGGNARTSMVALYDLQGNAVAMQLPDVPTPRMSSTSTSATTTATTSSDVTATTSSDIIEDEPVVVQATGPFNFVTREEVVQEEVSDKPQTVEDVDVVEGTEEEAEPVVQSARAPDAPLPQVAAAGTADLPTRWPLYTLVGLLLLGIGTVYLVPRQSRGKR